MPPPAHTQRGLSGRLNATFEPARSGVAARLTSTAPLELRGPFPPALSGASLPRFFLRNVTAGILDGDEYAVDLRAESGVAVRVESTSATKVFTSSGRGSRSRLRLEALPASTLQYSAGVTILHADACLAQDIEVVLHPGAAVAYLEVLALGRLARGERLAFRRYSSALAIRTLEGVPLYEERFDLEPGEDASVIDAAIAGAGVIGTLLLLGANADVPAIEESGELYAGASRLPNNAGILVRALGQRAEAVTAFLERIAMRQIPCACTE